MFEKKQDLIEFTMWRTGMDHDCAEDYVNQFIQEIYDCEGNIEKIDVLCYEFMLCDFTCICLTALDD